MWPFRKYRNLPLWLKMFNGGHRTPVMQQEALERIAAALKQGKEVVVLQDGEPVSITHDRSKVLITPIKNYRYEID